MRTSKIGWCLAVFLWAMCDSFARAPNIVILLSDDAGYADFSFQGSRAFETPRIDSIAANGARFTDGYVSGPVCSPTRAGLLTGRYQQRFGHEFNIPPVYSESNGLPLGEKTIADAFKASGYKTYAVGKWHLGYAPKFHPMSRGFDHYYGFLQGSRSYFPLKSKDRLASMLADRDPAKEDFRYLTDELGDAACRFIRDAGSSPFLLYVAFNAVHGPRQPFGPDLEQARARNLPRAEVAAMTHALDRAVGHILDALRAQGVYEDTMVFFLNDNGGAKGGHDNGPLRGHKGETWDGGVRVPFAVQWPARIPKGQVIADPVIALDIMPTALAAAGSSWSPPAKLDGEDLLPRLTRKQGKASDRALFWRSGRRWAIRQGDLKLTCSEGETPGLFDLRKDIGEKQDLSATQPGDVQRLQALYRDWEKSVRPPIQWQEGAGKQGKIKGLPSSEDS